MIGFDLNDVSNINIGNITIGSVYVGNTKIWGDTPTPPVHDYEQDYLTTIAKGSGNITFNIPDGVTTTDITSISYSTDNGTTWTTTNNVDIQTVTVTVSVNNGDKVLWKGEGTVLYHGWSGSAKFGGDVNFDVEGNIMSIINGDNFYHSSFAPNTDNIFNNALFNRSKVVDASNLILPITSLPNYCYATMFAYCTLLTSAPTLLVTTLTEYCYYGMFYGCTNLNYIKMMATDISASNCLSNWVGGVSATGTFVKDANTTIPTGANGIPSGWTVINE